MWQFVANNHEQLELSNPWEYPQIMTLLLETYGDLGIHESMTWETHTWPIYPLVNCHITMENHHAING